MGHPFLVDVQHVADEGHQGTQELVDLLVAISVAVARKLDHAFGDVAQLVDTQGVGLTERDLKRKMQIR